jgi:sigma-E factor negative regulatory protein RseB
MSGLTPRRLVEATLGMALLAAGLPVLAEQSVHQWLDRMSRAVETLDYRGTLVHVREGEVDTLKIFHRSDEEGVRERIISIDGAPREILRRGDNVRCIFPGGEPLMLESQLSGRLLPALPVNRLLGPDSTYLMSLGGQERVADMSAQIIHIQPRDAYRYGARLWLEEKTGMLLRYALIDHDGRQLQQVSFTSLELGATISDAELEPELSGEEMEGPAASEALRSFGAAARNISTAPRVPRGYRLINTGKGQGEAGAEFEHLLYSDGLSSFSIYIESAESGAMAGRVDSMGPVHVYTTRTGGRLFTVVGEVPSATVEFVGRQLRRSGRQRTRQ